MNAGSSGTKAYPLLFEPLLKERVWGGDSLRALGKRVPAGQRIGESWELADLPKSIPDGRSVISNGTLAGQSLSEVLKGHRALIMGDGRLSEQSGFPLLIKYLDARENLSVQVHPTPQYACEHEGTHLKSEAWIVVHAEDDAVIYSGLKANVGADDLKRHIAENIVEEDLVAVPARRGDCFYLPSGTCHALGAGVLVAEIQTPSDTTFRVYDWGRSGRELHISQALECITFGARPAEPVRPQTPTNVDGVRCARLLNTEYFAIERVDADRDSQLEFLPSGLPEVWMIIDGSGVIQSPGCADVELVTGTTTLLPAGLEGAHAVWQERTWMLRVKLPSPLSGMIAR